MTCRPPPSGAVAARRRDEAGIPPNAPRSLSVIGFAVILALVGCLCFSARAAADNHVSPAVAHADFRATLTPHETAWLKQQAVVRVAGPRAFPPFYFFEDDGRPQGMSLDYLTLIMEMIGLPFELEENRPWDDIMHRIQHRQIDLIPAAAKVPEREAFLRFSVGYLDFPAVIIRRQDAPFIGSGKNLEGLRVALIRDGAPQRWLEQQQIGVQPYFAASTLEALQGVSLGVADAHIENLATATYLIDKYGLANLKVAAPFYQENYALHVAVRKDWPELVAIIDKAIAALTPEQHADIRNRWLSVRYEHGLRWADVVQWFLLLVVSASVLILFVVYWNRRLQKEISARRETERILRQSESRYRALFERSSEGVLLHDVYGNILNANQVALDMFGYALEEICRMRLRHLVTADDVEHIRNRLQAILEDTSVTAEYCCRRRNGSEFTALARAKRVDDLMVQVVLQDVTLERQQSRLLHHARQQAEAASRAKSEFLASMSHEIRTPLNGVIGMTALLQDTTLTPEQHRYTDVIQSSGEALLTLINDILDFSKIEAGKVELEALEFDLLHLLEDCAVLMAVKAHAKDLELICHADAEVPTWLLGDPGRLRQILINLIGNAIKFTENGEVVIHVTSIACGPDGVRLRFAVRDTGIGISEDKIPLIFDKFSQADSTTTRRFGGTGLGLAISRQLATMMGGDIGASSAPHQGAEFWFTAQFRLPASPPKQLRPLPENLAGKRVLAVDDNATHLEILTHQLTRWGMQVVAQDNAPAALETLKAFRQTDRLFDLVITDMQMPEMDGVALGQAIQADAALRHIPLVILSSLGRPGDARRFGDTGFAAYLNKPVRALELYETLLVVISDEDACSADRAITTRHSARDTLRHCVSLPRLKGHVLVAEDNPVNQQVTLGILNKMGLTTNVACDGTEALRAWQTTPYDLILMDVEMPQMDGLEATRGIRRQEMEMQDARRVPIVAMTAHALQGSQEACLTAGMDDFVSKPVRLTVLVDVLARWLPPEDAENDAQNRLETDSPTALAPQAEPYTEPEATPVPESTEFDPAHLLAAVGNDWELLREILTVFLDDVPRRLELLKASLTRADMDNFRLQAHAIKGAAGNIGAHPLYALTSEMEQKALNQNSDGLEELLEQTEALFDTLKRDTEHIIST